MSYMYWDWGKFKKHFVVFAAYLCILNVSVFNVVYLNGLFCKSIPVGTIIVLLSACAVLLHIYNVLKFDYKWLSKTHKFQQVVTQLGLYLILCSVVFSVQLPQDIINKVDLTNLTSTDTQQSDDPLINEYSKSARWCKVTCLTYKITSQDLGTLNGADYQDNIGRNLVALRFENTNSNVVEYYVDSIYVVYEDGRQQRLKGVSKSFTLAPSAIKEFELPVFLDMEDKPRLSVTLITAESGEALNIWVDGDFSGINSETVNIKLY